MAQRKWMSAEEFSNRFENENDCRDYLFKKRWPDGLTCPKCGGKQFYKITSRNTYECKCCKHQVSLTAGTIMHGSHVPLKHWFNTIYFEIWGTGRTVKKLKKDLDMPSYQTAWRMLKKIHDKVNPYDPSLISELFF